MTEADDIRWMRLALHEARKGLGLTSPNPPVGAVLVGPGARLISKGYHRKAGAPHAEIVALQAAGSIPPDATLYVTLEPCSTHGKTPPCTDAILKAGIRNVIWAAADPNPLHAGRAGELLGKAGVHVRTGVGEGEARELLRPWSKFVTAGNPYVIAKAGMSVDGRITRPPGESQWLTSEAARKDAMRLRCSVDAILIGAETVRQDNPRLTVRGAGAPAGKEQPWRAVLTRSGNLPASAAIFTDEWKDRTLVFENTALADVMRQLAARGVVSVLIEGGGVVLAQAFAAGLVDEFHVYIAPLISGLGRPVVDAAAFGGDRSTPLRMVAARRVGPDIKLIYRAA